MSSFTRYVLDSKYSINILRACDFFSIVQNGYETAYYAVMVNFECLCFPQIKLFYTCFFSKRYFKLTLVKHIVN